MGLTGAAGVTGAGVIVGGAAAGGAGGAAVAAAGGVGGAAAGALGVMSGGRTGAWLPLPVAGGGWGVAFCACAADEKKATEQNVDGAKSAKKNGTRNRQRQGMVGRGLYHFLARA
ncbi:MAG: hypothetical protein FWD17_10450 [Polyangiaceae bacterium]|nr:hypothetical protein [Polyangiaceae bacterium]